MLYLCYLCRFKPLRDHLRGFLIAAWAGDKIAEFSFPEISFHFPLRPWFFFVSPAYAGKSPARFSSPRRCRDHPRVCGEKVPTFQPPSGAVGITPACAGKRLLLCWFRDHPRMCGEKFRAYAKIWNEWGSPPHVRGKAERRKCTNPAVWITPACAGKSCICLAQSLPVWDHPRMCGEKTKKIP